MRLDKYLKLSGLVKRRSLAKKLCDAGRVKLGPREAKPSTEVREGDVLELRFGQRGLVVEVLSVPTRPVSREQQSAVYAVHKEIRYA